MEVTPSLSRMLLWLIISLLTLLLSRAHSVVPEPLTYLEFVTSPSIEILPRNLGQPSIIRRDISLRHDDSLRIQFIAFNRTFSIHLEPNLDLFHPEATITIHHSNNSKTTTRLRPEDHRLYKGVLLDIDSTDTRLNEDIIGLKRKSLSEELSYSPGVLGWARIQIHDDGGVTQYSKNDRYPTFQGAFSLNNELYTIKSIENFKITQFKDDPEIPNPSARHHIHQLATMVIYRESDIKNTQGSSQRESFVGSCAMDDIVSTKNRHHGRIVESDNDQYLGQSVPWLSSLRIGNHKLTKRDTTGCPTAKKIAYMGAAADCTYVSNYNSPDAAREQILQDWSTASAVYEKTFNVTLGLINMVVLDPNCPSAINSTLPFNRPCNDSYDISQRLSDFSQWRGATPNDGVNLWHLMSKCSTGTKVGIAWLGQLCTTKATYQAQGPGVGPGYVSGTGVSTILKDEWKVVAHEIGHGFGAIHDCVTENCPCNNCGCCQLSSTTCDANNQYIMNPTSNVATDQFSPCSITTICQSIPNIGSCLEDPGTKSILTQAMCGNGIKESGEECDCGTSTDCANDPCCDGPTCKFKGNAVCDDKNDMCCSNCQYKPANAVCRPASSNCDIPEVCNGTSGNCPPDKHIADGTTCAPNLACAGGQCTSRDNQCLLRGGSMGITKACSSFADQSCDLSCANPNDTNSCIKMSGNFVDGTPCGLGGKCSNGQCDSGSIGNTILSWINQNKAIAIPIIVILGALLLCCMVQCVYRCCNRRQPQATKLRVPSMPPDDAYSRYNNYNNYYNTRNGSNWVDPTPYNGYNNVAPMPMPTPTPTHQQQRSRSPDYLYAGTGPIHPLPSQSTQRPNAFDGYQVPPVSPNLKSPSSPSSSNQNSSRRQFVDETLYNGPRAYNNYNNYPMNNDRQYRRQ